MVEIADIMNAASEADITTFMIWMDENNINYYHEDGLYDDEENIILIDYNTKLYYLEGVLT